MKGNNTMILNEATMIIAVQEWLNRQWPEKPPKVQSIDIEGDSARNAYSNVRHMFKVALQSEEPSASE